MPSVSRVGDLCTGHQCWRPRPNVSGSDNVFVNGIQAHRVGDLWSFHSCRRKGGHVSVLASGSSSVFVNGRPLGRIGDSVACGSRVAQGSGNVFAGG
jgi:uncharacterized Zn-binding protein involved in type VI secretion